MKNKELWNLPEGSCIYLVDNCYYDVIEFKKIRNINFGNDYNIIDPNKLWIRYKILVEDEMGNKKTLEYSGEEDEDTRVNYIYIDKNESLNEVLSLLEDKVKELEEEIKMYKERINLLKNKYESC